MTLKQIYIRSTKKAGREERSEVPDATLRTFCAFARTVTTCSQPSFERMPSSSWTKTIQTKKSPMGGRKSCRKRFPGQALMLQTQAETLLPPSLGLLDALGTFNIFRLHTWTMLLEVLLTKVLRHMFVRGATACGRYAASLSSIVVSRCMGAGLRDPCSSRSSSSSSSSSSSALGTIGCYLLSRAN